MTATQACPQAPRPGGPGPSIWQGVGSKGQGVSPTPHNVGVQASGLPVTLDTTADVCGHIRPPSHPALSDFTEHQALALCAV